ncbi:membrane protein [Clostridium beijerinckii]|uniref:glycan biosynthesis hexose transferase WsfD n=1 Tax=Clostridium beijerinckii TaxID=1520 RepID=UPI00047AEF56|nr:membrane protein [Clostridium beijerinckii]
MKVKKNLTNFHMIWFALFAIFITIGVLFIKPQVGVADQGDFYRILNISGLSLLDSDISNPNSVGYYDFIVSDYKIIPLDNTDSETICACSLSYLIIGINYICKSLEQNIFKTQYLAIIYSIIYILAFIIILKSLNIKNNIKSILIMLLTLFIFFDGNYLIWFNSLYGEPMMITTLLLFIASVLNYIRYKYVVNGTEKLMSKIFYILFSAFLFLGSKLQVITSLPIIMMFVSKIIWDNRYHLNKIKLIILCIVTCMVIIYPILINMNSNNLSKDTQYNSVFYGVLNESKTPEQDLIDLGLDPDLSAEAGKHAYLDSNEYVKYIPGSEITDEKFYSKINNFKLAKFYLTHPMRLLNGMKYTASKAFYTSTGLGKYSKAYSSTPIRDFHRFTLWSSIREKILPKNLFFIGLVYLTIMPFSLYKYIRNSSNREIKSKVLLLWTVMFIGILQFPMPFVGNGKADTAKQLFLFNFTFDGLLIIILSYILFKANDLFKIKLK